MPGGFHNLLGLQVAPIIPKLRRIFMRKQQVHAVVNRYNQFRRAEEGSFMMRHVNDVHILSTKRERNRNVLPPCRAVFRLIELLEVSRQRTELVEVPV